MLVQKQQETAHLNQERLQTQQNLLAKEKEAIEAKEMQANDLYKRAVDSGDADLMSKADTLKSDLSIQKEKVRAQEEAQQQNFQNPQLIQQEQYQNYQQPQQVAPDPSPQAKGWHEKTNGMVIIVVMKMCKQHNLLTLHTTI